MSEQSKITTPNPLIERLAVRVRAARKRSGIPRRELSERSGVSPRYLAQLETGEGNISVLLLQRVAAALDLKIEELLSEAGTLSDDTQRVARLYQQAPADIQGRVRGLLAPQNGAGMRAGRICLVGLRGAGKSTLGQRAAEALRIPFVELKTEIENRVGMPVAEIMGLYGQDGYRALEAESVEAVVQAHERVIMAVGGGLVEEADTYQRLCSWFHTIWIRTSPAEHMERVRGQGDLRPMAGNPQAMEQLKSLLAARTPMYAQALAQVDTSNRPEQSSVNDVLTVIAKNKFIDKPGP